MTTYRATITGNTYEIRGQLKADGFHYDGNAKTWYADYDQPITAEEIVRGIRALPRCRRADVTATIREIA